METELHELKRIIAGLQASLLLERELAKVREKEIAEADQLIKRYKALVDSYRDKLAKLKELTTTPF